MSKKVLPNHFKSNMTTSDHVTACLPNWRQVARKEKKSTRCVPTSVSAKPTFAPASTTYRKRKPNDFEKVYSLAAIVIQNKSSELFIAAVIVLKLQSCLAWRHYCVRIPESGCVSHCKSMELFSFGCCAIPTFSTNLWLLPVIRNIHISSK